MKGYINVKTAAVALVAVVVIVAAVPGAVSYLPLLILAACPFMMFFMHGGGGHGDHGASASGPAQLGEYVCPMHPEIRSTFAGECPVCGMKLETAEPVHAGSHHER